MKRPSGWRGKVGAAAHRAGLRAEFWASALLLAKGYRILARRLKTHVGEIDLIARRGKVLIFVEVKARGAMDSAVESLSLAQRERLRRAAELYLASRPQFSDFTIRFDMVLASPKRFPKHLIDAWRPS